MNAWPMIARCLLAQWRGYSSDTRKRMEEAWDHLPSHEAPGNTIPCGHGFYPIWQRFDPGYLPVPSDYLISIKEDRVPQDLL